jgi:predicted nucleic acid-binding protein
VNVLVDTSVWSLALRRKARDLNANERRIVAELTELVGEGRARITGIIRQELLSGIRFPAQFEKLRTEIAAFPDEAVQTADHESAAESSNTCRARGIAVSVVDALLCAIALKRGWSIFTTDPDFSHYARVVAFELHRPRR